MTTNSTWTALCKPAFRKLWIATVISGTCVAAYDSAATWIMNMPQMGRFFSSMSGALQIASEGRAYHRRLLYA